VRAEDLGARGVPTRDRRERPAPLEPGGDAGDPLGALVDGFRLGPTAPEHKAVVDGDEKSAAIAAASIVAKVVRDRTMRRLAAVYPHYGFSSHVGYITPGHSAVVRERGPSVIHRRSFEARCYAPEQLAETR
jgi:ribonuclease HII